MMPSTTDAAATSATAAPAAAPAGAPAAGAGDSPAHAGTPISAVSGPSATRLQSLDAFRGITIAGMLLVNNPGTWSAIHPPLAHAEWHGWTPTDLIFPFFLYIVGVAMTFSFAARTERGAKRSDLMLGAARRAAILFGLGLLLHGFPNYLDLSTLRIPGVLQRIALAYLAASATVLFLRRNAQIATAALILLGYWALMTLVPVPGSGAGVLEKGMDLGAYIDRAVFGEAHLWSQARTWDPEGLLSTLPAVGTVLLGVFTGTWLRSNRAAGVKTRGLLIAGVTGIGAGLLWGMLFPINKSLWTSSYVVFTGGMACVFLAVCYWTIDVKGMQAWAKPFVIFGTNAITAFFLSGIFARLLTLVRVQDGRTVKGYVYETVFAPMFSPVNASLAYAICFVMLWLGLMSILYRRRIFLKV